MTYGEYINSLLRKYADNQQKRDVLVKFLTWVLNQDWLDWNLEACTEWIVAHFEHGSSNGNIYFEMLPIHQQWDKPEPYVSESINTLIPMISVSVCNSIKPIEVSAKPHDPSKHVRQQIKGFKAARANARITRKNGKPLF